jgi:hypothetical protein
MTSSIRTSISASPRRTDLASASSAICDVNSVAALSGSSIFSNVSIIFSAIARSILLAPGSSLTVNMHEM